MHILINEFCITILDSYWNTTFSCNFPNKQHSWFLPCIHGSYPAFTVPTLHSRFLPCIHGSYPAFTVPTLHSRFLHCIHGSYTAFTVPTLHSRFLHCIHGSYPAFTVPTLHLQPKAHGTQRPDCVRTYHDCRFV